MLAHGDEHETERIFTQDDFLLKWLEKISLQYTKDIKLGKSKTGHCYYEYIYKFMKTIHTTPVNFLKDSLAQENPYAINVFEYFYFPKMEIEKTEYSNHNDTRSEILDGESDRFDDDNDMEGDREEVVIERSGSRGEIGVNFEDSEAQMYMSQERQPHDENFAEDGDKNKEHEEFHDSKFWKARIDYNEDLLKDLRA